jgi:2-polyprenyl-3-methyl-5-hydroxy-6-metoxy-1,4-benzoquinol methylase
MNFVDRLIQRIRIRQAAAYIPDGARLLDIGCDDGAIFELLGNKLSGGVGIDPNLAETVERSNYQLIAGFFPDDFPSWDKKYRESFDAITILAVLEHISLEKQRDFAEACVRCLKPDGVILVTIPSERVDAILDIMQQLRIIDGMSLDEHFGFSPAQVPGLFEAIGGVALVEHKRFELGLNNLYVFRKVGLAGNFDGELK